MGISRRISGASGRVMMGRVIPGQLLKGIRRHLERTAPGSAEETIESIRARTDELVAADAAIATDAPAKGMLVMSAVVLASYEALLPGFDGDERRTILFLQEVFGEILKRSTEVAAVAMTRGTDPLGAIETALSAWLPMYGEYFEYEIDRPEPGAVEMRISRCFFRDFFARHGALPVTTVLCSWDANWMRAINPARTGVHTARPTTLSLGADACRFQVFATDDPLAPSDDVIEGQPAPG